MKILFFLMIGSITTPAFAAGDKGGDGKGNGGIAQVCRNAAGDIISIELLDLVRARRPVSAGGLGLEIPARAEPATVQWTEAFTPFPGRQELKSRVEDAYRLAFYRHVLGKPGVHLLSTDDGDVPRPDSGCGFEQLAIFLRGGSLIVQPELYAALEKAPTSLAAFYLHESLYLISGLTNSRLIQELVGRLLAPATSPKDLRAISERIYGAGHLVSATGCDPSKLAYPPPQTAVLDFSSAEPVRIQVMNLDFVPKSELSATLYLNLANKRSLRLQHFRLEARQEFTMAVPFLAPGLRGASLSFSMNNPGWKATTYPLAQLKLRQGDRTIGIWNAPEGGPGPECPRAPEYSPTATGQFVFPSSSEQSP